MGDKSSTDEGDIHVILVPELLVPSDENTERARSRATLKISERKVLNLAEFFGDFRRNEFYSTLGHAKAKNAAL